MIETNVTPVSIILDGESPSTSVRSTGLWRLNRSRRRLISDGLICHGLGPGRSNVFAYHPVPPQLKLLIFGLTMTFAMCGLLQ